MRRRSRPRPGGGADDRASRPHRTPADRAAVGLDVSLAGVDAFHVFLRHPPRAGLVFDLGSGEVLWRLHPRRTLPIASLTKIMTALLVAERTRPNERVLITQAALDYSGSGVGLLPKGRRVRLETLLNGLLIVSGNDAAIALAVHMAGSEARFVRRMNQRAAELGLALHALRLLARARGRQPLVRARPRGPHAARHAPRAHPPRRAHRVRRAARSRSRAASSTCRATTR